MDPYFKTPFSSMGRLEIRSFFIRRLQTFIVSLSSAKTICSLLVIKPMATIIIPSILVTHHPLPLWETKITPNLLSHIFKIKNCLLCEIVSKVKYCSRIKLRSHYRLSEFLSSFPVCSA